MISNARDKKMCVVGIRNYYMHHTLLKPTSQLLTNILVNDDQLL